MMQQDPKHKTDSGNEANEILQKENLIDPGNEHNHLQHNEDKSANEKEQRAQKKESESNAAGTTGPEPGEGKNDEPDTTGEDG